LRLSGGLGQGGHVLILGLVDLGFVDVLNLILVNSVLVLVDYGDVTPQSRLEPYRGPARGVLLALLAQQQRWEVYVDRVDLLLLLNGNGASQRGLVELKDVGGGVLEVEGAALAFPPLSEDVGVVELVDEVAGDAVHVLEVGGLVLVEIAVDPALAGLVDLRGGLLDGELNVVLDLGARDVLLVEDEL